MSSPLTIDIVIPAKNEERHISECLSALFSQDYPRDCYHVFVVDNGSNDNTPEIVKQFPAQLIQVPEPSISAAMNQGIMSGKSTLVGFLDAHCIPANNWLSTMATMFNEQCIGAVAGPIEMHFDNKLLEKNLAHYFNNSELYPNNKNPVNTNIYALPMIRTGNAMYLRKALQEANLFDETLRRNQDVDLTWKVLLLGYKLAYTPHATMQHYDTNTWCNFFIKNYKNGIGGAELLAKYNLPSLSVAGFHLSPFKYPNLEIALFYLCQFIGLRIGQLNKTARKIKHPLALDTFRPHFEWKDRLKIKIASNAAYWHDENHQTHIVTLQPYEKTELSGIGHLIWTLLEKQLGYEDILQQLQKNYPDIDRVVFESDLTEFVTNLLEKGLLELHQEGN